ncbi:MAG: TerB family tellurite resistance protein [Candidatus Eisenbacteria bacterium]|uniref:TerB family tellurite resistance protein n=1 Tax=Eiseniibacteriota bacterium TaxID=2212470 RepID=A0A956M0X8_UNCEI|nr:TerB family tellurite resistance protein [Candidatus Eisenbacteria bacterium]
MTSDSTEARLLRVLATLAWMDGNVTEPERRFLRGLAVEYGLGLGERMQIEEMLETPLSREDFERALHAFQEVASAEDHARLMSRAERLIEADSARAPEEVEALRLIRESLRETSGPSTGVLGKLRGLLGGGNLGELARELVGRSPERNDGIGGDAERRRAYATLFGALLYRVIYADRVVEPEEAARLRSLLAERFDFQPAEVDYVLRAIQLRVAQDLDRQRLCAEFNRITAMEERLGLLRAMLELAMADGEISPEEDQEIRLIANFLWIEVQDFVATRKSVVGR